MNESNTNVDCGMWIVEENFHKPSTSTIHHPPSTIQNRSRGFTLMEILIVVAIILLVVSVAFPLFQVLRGSRSTEAAQNVVSAALGYARTRAINEGRPHGVLFFVDPANDSTRLWIVRRGYDTTDDSDPLDRYKGWYAGGTYRYFAPDGDSAPIQEGDRVASVSRDVYIGQFYEDSQSGPLQKIPGKPLVRAWQTKEYPSTTSYYHTPQLGSAGNPAPPGTEASTITNTTTATTADSTMSNVNWERVKTNKISRVTDLEELRLPPGTGVQLMIDTGNWAYNTTDRYVRTGLILFDSQGRLTFDTFIISKDSEIGQQLGLKTDTVSLTPAFGLVAFDQIDMKRSASATDNDWARIKVGNNDYIIPLLNSNYFPAPPKSGPAGTISINSTTVEYYNPSDYDLGLTDIDERGDEVWLDDNSAPILINRYSGTLSLTE